MIYSLFESPWCLFVPEFWNKPKKIILFINENNTKTPKIRTHDWEKKVSSIDAHANHYASAPGWAASRIDLGFLICVLSDSAGRESEWEIEFLLCPIVDTETVTTQGRLDWCSWFLHGCSLDFARLACSWFYGGNHRDLFHRNFESSYLINGSTDWLDFLYGNII